MQNLGWNVSVAFRCEVGGLNEPHTYYYECKQRTNYKVTMVFKDVGTFKSFTLIKDALSE